MQQQSIVLKELDNGDYTMEEVQNIISALNFSVIVAITNPQGKITFVNQHFCDIAKYTKEELIGQDHRILNSGYHPKSFFKEMWRTIGSGKTWKGDVCNRAKDGSLYWVKTTVVPFLNEKGKPYQYVAIRTDITAQKDIKKVTELAYRDELTNLPNRRRLNKTMNDYINQVTPFAVVFIDVNRFRNINDGLGHVVGDLFLKEMATRLASLNTAEEMFFRYNSDEFIFITKDVAQIDRVARRIIGLFDESFLIDDFEFYASISIGISIFTEDAHDSEQLLKNADTALLSAKQSHKISDYQVYQPNLNRGHDKWLMMETKLHNAIKLDKLELHYQPKINIKNDTLVGMEALLRWHDEDLGQVYPDTFIPFAEECGLIGDIGVWVLDKATRQVKAWNEQYGTSLHVAVNISPMHLTQENFVASVQATIDEVGLRPQELEIEITEMTMLDYTEDLIQTITSLRELGIAISIDDFGTGYSSLSYLKKFPIDALKIDRAFVQDIIPEPSGVAMTAAIISLAHALGLYVVAEGVEEPEELAVLERHGCEFVQGYYFSRPLPAAEFEKLITQPILRK
ncbi:diguanylate cyclase [Lysinibacillus sp. BF-4]|uniref:bifunctional diguanylate cyclase/phosphodiesterase n=1 Tax=Lysinibacillus sp. BF-4 TaxID=1473546 RepID=UPI0005066446|nr:GGDEF and EAL domain-containing protein [Lysinibacillus sp. BF-4]KFL42403.1 diguanylate cyclase [Lysinibacillus sp. BF-4]